MLGGILRMSSVRHVQEWAIDEALDVMLGIGKVCMRQNNVKCVDEAESAFVVIAMD